jgi:D-hydroxyproline dehydrogenase subunit beta
MLPNRRSATGGSLAAVPDVVVVGGGIIGCATAFELASRGARVTLLERDELAAGASGRNLGYVDTSKDPVLAPLARRSLERYLELTERPPFPVFLDREPIGTLAVTIDEDELEDLRMWAASASAVGVDVTELDPEGARALEPELSPDVLAGYLLREGHRVDPTAMTLCLAALARASGATIEHHRPARRLVIDGDRVTGLVTDDSVIPADVVVLAAGPWSSALVRPLGVALPIRSARGWLVHAAPARRLIHHWIQSGARRLLTGNEAAGGHDATSLEVTVGGFAEGAEEREVSPMIQPAPDGSVITGTSREPSFAADSFDLEIPRQVARSAARLVPALTEAPVVATWSGVRPVSPDERPLLGWLREGLFVAGGHGSEGVILGEGSAQLAAEMVLGETPWLDPAPFDPARFD